MEFIAEKEDYNVGEFYDKFAKSLPKIVMVNQGFMGEISADTFDRGQIIRFHTVSQQSRIVAKAEHHKQTKFFSIPVSFQHNLCVVKHGRAGKEMPLSQVIRDHPLPTHVQFPKNRTLNVGNHTVHTNNLPTMDLTRAFNEIYMLGNFIVDGVLSNEVVHVPLYLSQLRFSLITGIVGQAREKWKSYQEELNRSTLIIEFDREFGNPDIAEYQPGRIEKVAIDEDLEYAKIEPSIYTNFHSIFRAGLEARAAQIPTSDTLDTDPDVYEEIANTSSSNPVKMTSFKTELSYVVQAAPKRTPPKIPQSDKKEEAATSNTPTTKRRSPPAVPKKTARDPPPIQKKPQRSAEENIYVNNISHVTPVQVKPETPQVNASPSPRIDKKAKHTDTPPKKEVPLASSEVVARVPTNDAAFSTGVNEQHLKASKVANTPPKKRDSVDVDSLNIDEVGEYLKALGLGQYVEVFKENLIDGKLLKELDKDVLKTDFNMKAVEAIKMMVFIEQGHVPS